jgi:PAS domain S-box-containing protein
MAILSGSPSESRLRRLFDANVIGILICTLRGTVLDANDAFLRTIGYTRADLEAGRIDWRRLTPLEWDAADQRALDELATGGVFEKFEKEYIHRDGTRVPVALGGARIVGTGEAICYVVDRGAERAALQRLEQSEARYRALADDLPQVIMLSNAERRLVYANRYYEEFTGIPNAELQERWRDPLHPDDVERVAAARASGAPFEVEYRLRRADGVYRWHYARCYPVRGNSPDLGWLATAIDIDDRKRAEETLRFLERASTRLSQSLDLHTTFETLFDLVVPELGDWALITLRDEAGSIRAIAGRHREPAKAEAVGQICRDAFGDDSTAAVVEVYRTGRPVIFADVALDDIRRAVRQPFVAAVEALGFGSHIALPIFDRGTVIGSFGIVSAGTRRTYTASDLPALEELARRAGIAITNARSYEREHRVADILQAAALPRRLPVVSGFSFDAYYQAGRSEARIGGDWYDAVVIADGRIVISVGDVAGSGLGAAVTMSNVRQVIRAAAHVSADPLAMLDVADRTLRSEVEEPLVTAFVGVIDPVARSLEYASAGHLPPLLRDADGSLTELWAAGPPLGCRDVARSESKRVALPRAGSLVLFTDGLVEWDRDLLAGEAALRREVAAGTALRGEHPARTLVARLLPADGARDDVAVLTVEIRPI